MTHLSPIAYSAKISSITICRSDNSFIIFSIATIMTVGDKYPNYQYVCDYQWSCNSFFSSDLLMVCLFLYTLP